MLVRLMTGYCHEQGITTNIQELLIMWLAFELALMTKRLYIKYRVLRLTYLNYFNVFQYVRPRNLVKAVEYVTCIGSVPGWTDGRNTYFYN